MISYSIDAIILLAVAATGFWLWRTHCELSQLKGHHTQYQRILSETGSALAAIDMAVRDINAHGSQILLALGDRIDEGYRMISEIDEHMDAVAGHFEAQREAETNVVQFAAQRPPAPEPYREARPPEPQPAAQRPVQWPSLGDRFSQWRQSEDRQAAGQRR
ncbi:hypothetical protein BH10PSE7_BH10PSE7_30700 [soil metagenome]